MPTEVTRIRQSARPHDSCSDPMIGVILSGWRYDLSGISPSVRGEYQDHLESCPHCRGKQRLHRTVDLLLLCATTLSFAAFLLAALVMHRLEALTHIGTLHLHLHPELRVAHVPQVITVSLEAVAIAGVVVSMLLWVLVAIATPAPAVITGFLRSRSDARAFKHAA